LDFFKPIYASLFLRSHKSSAKTLSDSKGHIYFSHKLLSDTIVGTILKDRTASRVYGRAGLFSEALNFLIEKSNIRSVEFDQVRIQNNDIFELFYETERFRGNIENRFFIFADEFVANKKYQKENFYKIINLIYKIKSNYPEHNEITNQLENLLLKENQFEQSFESDNKKSISQQKY
jgi:hypothetical protein